MSVTAQGRTPETRPTLEVGLGTRPSVRRKGAEFRSARRGERERKTRDRGGTEGGGRKLVRLG